MLKYSSDIDHYNDNICGVYFLIKFNLLISRQRHSVCFGLMSIMEQYLNKSQQKQGKVEIGLIRNKCFHNYTYQTATVHKACIEFHKISNQHFSSLSLDKNTT